MNARRGLGLAFAVAILVFGLAVLEAACGVKSPPRPPSAVEARTSTQSR